MKTNKRLSPDKAAWLATQWAQPNAQGEWRILGDAAHKVVNPYLFRLDEVLEIYKRITAPTLMVEASDDSLTLWWKGKFTLEEFHERLKAVPDIKTATLQDAGHMLHHDRSEELATLLEDFLN
jgi:pimeloyl-ACP methyl ester carboxylesterase